MYTPAEYITYNVLGKQKDLGTACRKPQVVLTMKLESLEWVMVNVCV